MTIDELNVSQRYNIPVVITGDKYIALSGTNYHISQITQYYDSEFKCYERSATLAEDEFVIGIYIRGSKSLHDKKEELEEKLNDLIAEHTGLSYEVTLEKSQRCSYTIDAHYLTVASGFENLLNSKLEELKKDRLSVFLGNCLLDGMTRKEINALVKSVLDKLEKKNAPKLKNKDIVEEFEKLWKLYPRKQGKKTALSAYISARKKGTTYEDVEKGIKAYVEVIRKCSIKPEFIKQGGVWFKGEHWNDEYSISSPSNKLSSPPSFDINKIQQDAMLNDNYDI